MNVNSALTQTEKTALITSVVEQLKQISKSQRLEELLRDVELGKTKFEEEEIFIAKTLKATSSGIVLETFVWENFRIEHSNVYGPCGYESWKTGGTKNTSSKPVREFEFQTITEEFDLDPEKLKAILKRMEVN